jgi:hypothetical protein
MSTGDGGTAVLWLILSLVVFWLLIYTAVTLAVGHALDRTQPRLVAEARTTPEGVDFVVTNSGTGPAFDLFVRWTGDAAESMLAYAPLLAVNGTLEWTIAAGPIRDETPVVRGLMLDWALGVKPSLGRHSSRREVLVPSRLARPE